MKHLPKEEFDTLVGACDVGLIFLDHRFTTPNFPSRLLSYMQAKLPVIASSDVGTTIEKGKFGWWIVSENSENFKSLVNKVLTANTVQFGENGYSYAVNNFSVDNGYRIINKRRC